MKCLLLYDIPDDKIRTKIATFCLDYGLDRIQYSAFMGDLSSNHQEELMLKLARRLGKAAGKIDLFPVCKEDWRGRISIQQEGEASAAESAT
ncbi:MAG: CRISPR-associated endonuclease Cas2 [Caldilinea sp.]|nr:CRISPR-associated endonuclease Cas2 [Caldilinea sp.]